MVECAATLIRCTRCLMLTPRARLAEHDRVCLLQLVLDAWRDVAADGVKISCPHSGGSGDAGGCTFVGNRASLRAHLDEGCPFEPVECEARCGARVPRRAQKAHMLVCPLVRQQTSRERHGMPNLICAKCGAPTEIDGTEVVVRIGTLAPARILCLEVDDDGRSPTYGEELLVKRMGVRLRLAPVVREPHAKRCPMATGRCEYCLREMVRTSLNHHEQLCDERKQPCVRKCGAQVSRRGLAEHDRICPNMSYSCPYGCGKKVRLRDLQFRSTAAAAGGKAPHPPASSLGARGTAADHGVLAKDDAWAFATAGGADVGAPTSIKDRWGLLGSGPSGAVSPIVCEPCEPELARRDGRGKTPAARAIAEPRLHTRSKSTSTPLGRARTPQPSLVIRPEPIFDPAESKQLLLKATSPHVMPPLSDGLSLSEADKNGSISAARAAEMLGLSRWAAPTKLIPCDSLLAPATSPPRYLALVFIRPENRDIVPLLQLLEPLSSARPELRVLLVPLGANEVEVSSRRALVPSAYCLPPLGADNERIGRDFGARRGTSMVLLHMADMGLICFDAARALLADAEGALFPWASEAPLSRHALSCPRYWVACTNAHCTFSGMRTKVNAHKVSCMWRMLPCRRKCGAVLVVTEHKEHALVCPRRPAECKRSCGVSVTVGEIDSGEHDKVCPLKGLRCQACEAVVPRKSMGNHTDQCPELLITCRYGCSRRLKRRDMPDHAKECTGMGIKRFPVCDGYCCRRCPLHYDSIYGPPDGTARQKKKRPSTAGSVTKSARGSGSARPISPSGRQDRRSWMMMSGVSVHWKGTHEPQRRGMKFFPTADSKAGLGMCISQTPASIIMPKSTLRSSGSSGNISRLDGGSPPRSRSPDLVQPDESNISRQSGSRIRRRPTSAR